MCSTYNGWANYQTWNVSLWINNQRSAYETALEFVQSAPKHRLTYKNLVGYLRDRGDLPADFPNWEARGHVTPDGVSWTDPTLDLEALDAMVLELKETVNA